MKLFLGLNKRFTPLLIALLAMEEVLAQEASVIIDDEIGSIVIDKGPFYAQLWFWIVIGFVFLIILIVLIRGNGRKGKKKVEDKSDKKEKEKIEDLLF